MNMNHIRPISWLSGYFQIPLALGGILILADILILMISVPAAIVLTIILMLGVANRLSLSDREVVSS